LDIDRPSLKCRRFHSNLTLSGTYDKYKREKRPNPLGIL
jgi:hypothetical protein